MQVYNSVSSDNLKLLNGLFSVCYNVYSVFYMDAAIHHLFALFNVLNLVQCQSKAKARDHILIICVRCVKIKDTQRRRQGVSSVMHLSAACCSKDTYTKFFIYP